MYEHENAARERGFSLICGIDEAGRGPFAGPVCAAAVILDEDNPIEGLNDSKKLSEKKREQLFEEIIKKAKSYCVTMVDVKRIDEINILAATMEAMEKVAGGMDIKPQLALVDGDKEPKLDCQVLAIIGGDALSASIGAASILAKVTRDRYMVALSEKYPQYGFEKHKGYGTKAHCAAILQHGMCNEHRRSFLKKLEAREGKLKVLDEQ